MYCHLFALDGLEVLPFIRAGRRAIAQLKRAHKRQHFPHKALRAKE